MEIATDRISEYEIDGSRKRKKLSGDERLRRNRERNKMHARKTRERKKLQTVALQTRVTELQEEGLRLRQMVDERYTASVLLGMCSQTYKDSSKQGEPIVIVAPKSSHMICNNAYASALTDNNWFGENGDSLSGQKRIRRRGKYSPQERERIRRERNRMHAKRTRDRKKMFLEVSEQIINEMEAEAKLLRQYLFSLKLIGPEEIDKAELRAQDSKRQLAVLKASQDFDIDDDDKSEDDDDLQDEDDDNGDGDDEHDNNDSLSGSDDNEKASWNGSNDGSRSSNHDSMSGGDTSGDGTSSTGSSGNHTTASSSLGSQSGSLSRSGGDGSSSSSGSHLGSASRGMRDGSTGSGSGSGSGGDSPRPKHDKHDKHHEKERKKKESQNRSGGNSSSSSGTSSGGGTSSTSSSSSVKSQSIESYHHGDPQLKREHDEMKPTAEQQQQQHPLMKHSSYMDFSVKSSMNPSLAAVANGDFANLQQAPPPHWHYQHQQILRPVGLQNWSGVSTQSLGEAPPPPPVHGIMGGQQQPAAVHATAPTSSRGSKIVSILASVGQPGGSFPGAMMMQQMQSMSASNAAGGGSNQQQHQQQQQFSPRSLMSPLIPPTGMIINNNSAYTVLNGTPLQLRLPPSNKSNAPSAL